ncbi:TM0106 family RecB-like putative nuclease [Candidatus Pacearchaeota archaeon]|nr:TM0106 family RecB-like putative nuclease [Candidatus Pacearchaeota archaeon]
MNITASNLYSYIKCPHRVWRDAHDDQELKDPPNDFVQLLWEHGAKHEKEIITQKQKVTEILDLSQVPLDQRFNRTIEAMKNRTAYIYQGCLEVDNLIGSPDILELQSNGEYMPIEIKSGMSVEGEDDFSDGKYKKGYAVQLALYIDSLIRLGCSSQKIGKILDSSGSITEYDFNLPRGVRTPQIWWDFYRETLNRVSEILGRSLMTEPALGSVCNECEWKTDCKKSCVNSKCVTLIPELGRAMKENFKLVASSIVDLANLNIENQVDSKGKTGIPGVGIKTLEKMQRRAKLLVSGSKKPLLLKDFTFPEKEIELFFDLEVDPTQDIVYLHGVVERRGKDNLKLKFHSFVTDEVTSQAEKKAWDDFFQYIKSLPENSWSLYYYSKYERTQYRALAVKYPDVVSSEEVEEFFNPEKSIDLYYDVVKKCTEWPTYNQSIKTLAQHLGFKWRDSNPSGAASIQWFNEWCDSQEEKILKRILDYNEDDCLAMIKLKDSLQELASAK